MLDFYSAATIATLLCSMPIVIVARTVMFALASKHRFAATNCLIESHHQPKNEAEEPLHLRLRYIYAVESKTYTGRRYYFGSRNECNASLLRKYPEGSQHTVYYDPKDPSQSTLNVGIHPGLWFWVIAVAILCSVLWVALVAALVGEWKLSSDAGLL